MSAHVLQRDITIAKQGPDCKGNRARKKEIFRSWANEKNRELEEKLIIDGQIDFLSAGNCGQGFESRWIHRYDQLPNAAIHE